MTKLDRVQHITWGMFLGIVGVERYLGHGFGIACVMLTVIGAWHFVRGVTL